MEKIRSCTAVGTRDKPSPRFECARSGVCIQTYPDDMPFPSALIFVMADNEPLHVVVAFDEEGKKAYIITAYKPSPNIFEPDCITRKK